MKRLVVDLSTGTEQYVDMTPEEVASVQAACDEAAQVRAAEDARIADQVAAGKDIKKLAKQGKPIDAATFARFAGIDINAPDPAQPPAG